VNKVATAIGIANNFQLRMKSIDVNTIPISIKGIPSQATGSLLFIFVVQLIKSL